MKSSIFRKGMAALDPRVSHARPRKIEHRICPCRRALPIFNWNIEFIFQGRLAAARMRALRWKCLAHPVWQRVEWVQVVVRRVARPAPKFLAPAEKVVSSCMSLTDPPAWLLLEGDRCDVQKQNSCEACRTLSA